MGPSNSLLIFLAIAHRQSQCSEAAILIFNFRAELFVLRRLPNFPDMHLFCAPAKDFERGHLGIY